jgi:hypothetical protein
VAEASKVVDLDAYRLRRLRPQQTAVEQLVETIAIYDEVIARLDTLQKRTTVREARS